MDNDLISRSALLDKLQPFKEGLTIIFEGLENGIEKRLCSAEICGVLEAIIQVKNAPAVDPKTLRPKGRWIMTIYTTTSKRGRVISNTKFACSECGYSNGRKQSNFCPNCGADMRGDGE